MKATGIVRRIDDLGRVVIPKEIRRTMRIREGDPLEIFTDNNGEVIFKKYSPIGELSAFAGDYGDCLNKISGYPVIVCDRDHVVSVAGMPKKEVLERRITPQLEDMMDLRKTHALSSDSKRLHPVEGVDRFALVASPIVAAGDVVGSVMLMAQENGAVSSETEVKLVQTAAAFLGRQMEE
ncbi:MAG: AbrB/MazE/SpoVT family DNA-binding domain-containing protein [Oscillospiraceae bacterium]|nr:AbrB/MazE/SpoVT family DNA-binding domain-containing protein [Oscillospiraceae bacterium]